jgi:hypothetical protein
MSMNYTYEPHLPEAYGGKMFLVTPETGDKFMVSVAVDESEVPALVEHHLNPPAPQPYPAAKPAPLTIDEQIAALTARVEALEAASEA